MDGNDYVIDTLVRDRLREARALAARHDLLLRFSPRRPALRARIGAALIALGERLAGAPAAGRPYAARRATHG